MSDRSEHDCTEPVERSDQGITPSRERPETDRRRLLTATGGTGVAVLAGCIGEEDEDTPDDDVAAYDVAFFDQDETVEVPEDEPLLYPALDAGVEIPYSCEVGTCGECTARYDGDATEVVTHDGNDYLEDNQIEDGWLLTCVGYADDDFEVEVAHPDDE